MAATITIPEDPQKFKTERLEGIQKMVSAAHSAPVCKWPESHEVWRLLTISPDKLQALRDTVVLPFTSIGAVICDNYEDIESMLPARVTNKVSSQKPFNV